MGPFHEIGGAEHFGGDFMEAALLRGHFRNERHFALIENMWGELGDVGFRLRHF